ncbi:MAG: hypothetical protein ACI4XH_01780 [Acutalibacteraceae bacterium]
MFEYSDTEFIKLNRKILEWEWFSDVCTRDVFIYCLLKANWKPGNWHGIEYKRGEFITSIRQLAKDLGHSEQQTRTALNKLKSTHEITIESTHRYSIITVVNWSEYQVLDNSFNTPSNTQSNIQTTHYQHSEQQQRKNIKENKNKRNIPARAENVPPGAEKVIDTTGYSGTSGRSF